MVMPDYVRYNELASMGIPWSRPHVNLLEKSGQFPKRIQIGPRTIMWKRQEIIDYVAQGNTAKAA